MAIEIGKAAPAFSAKDQDGKTVKKADLKGSWVVLYFYPKDNTPGCTTEACEFTESIKAFEKLEAKVIGISPDSPESHRKFIEKQNLQLQLLSDPEHEMLEKYEAWGLKKNYGKEYEGVIRSTVLVDPAGKVAYHWGKVTAKGHAQQVREKLAELKG